MTIDRGQSGQRHRHQADGCHQTEAPATDDQRDPELGERVRQDAGGDGDSAHLCRQSAGDARGHRRGKGIDVGEPEREGRRQQAGVAETAIHDLEQEQHDLERGSHLQGRDQL